MKTTIADKLALSSIGFTAALTIGSWAYAFYVEAWTERMMQSEYAQAMPPPPAAMVVEESAETAVAAFPAVR